MQTGIEKTINIPLQACYTFFNFPVRRFLIRDIYIYFILITLNLSSWIGNLIVCYSLELIAIRFLKSLNFLNRHDLNFATPALCDILGSLMICIQNECQDLFGPNNLNYYYCDSHEAHKGNYIRKCLLGVIEVINH